jgi:integrase
VTRKTTKTRRGRDEGSVYQRADGKWCASVSAGFDAAGKRRRIVLYGKDKGEVVRKIELARSKLNQRSIEADYGRVTVGDFLDTWLEQIQRPQIRFKTYQGYEGAIRLHIKPHIGKLELAKLTPLALHKMYGHLERSGVGATTRRYVHVTLSAALKRALRLHLIETNPIGAVDAPRVKPQKATPLTMEQLEALFVATAIDRLRNLYIVAATTGMRPGEVLGLKWNAVDLKHGVLSVVLTIEDHHGKCVVGEPKTAGSRRRIDLPRRCIDALKAQRELLIAEGLRASEWVFPSSNGTPLSIRNVIARSFKPALERAKLPNIRLYDLRHSAATIMLMAGIPLKVVSERLGHSSIKITADTYQHVLPSLQQEAVAKLDIAFGANPSPVAM